MLSLGNGVQYKDLLFDPTRKAADGLVLISHAHSDHARQHDTTTIMTPETSKITGITGKVLSYGKTHQFGEFRITPYPAGHIIGSAQYLVEDGKTIVYTGDFRLKDSILFPGAEPLNCDELVIESTFGSPEYTFPDPYDVYKDMSGWVSKNHSRGRIVLIGAYSIGKAQEITRMLNEYTAITPLVHPKIKAVNDTSVLSGVKLGDYLSLDSEEAREISREPFVALLPHRMISRNTIESVMLQTGRDVVACVATGWAGRFSRFKAFPLSDHADFNQLVDYVEHAEPKKVYTTHGFAKTLASQLSHKGFNAKPLEKANRQS